MTDVLPLIGRCSCGGVSYRLTDRPLFVHCCHCTWCQRESGSAFALNAIIETARLEVISGTPEWVTLPSASGRGQRVARCPDCRIALWSVYGGAGPLFSFVRVGTLEDTTACPPDIHIFTESRRSWVILPDDGTPVLPAFYRRSEYWPADSLARREAALAEAEAQAGQ